MAVITVEERLFRVLHYYSITGEGSTEITHIHRWCPTVYQACFTFVGAFHEYIFLSLSHPISFECFNKKWHNPKIISKKCFLFDFPLLLYVTLLFCSLTWQTKFVFTICIFLTVQLEIIFIINHLCIIIISRSEYFLYNKAKNYTDIHKSNLQLKAEDYTGSTLIYRWFLCMSVIFSFKA